MTPRHKSTVALLAALFAGVLLLIAAAPEGREPSDVTTPSTTHPVIASIEEP